MDSIKAETSRKQMLISRALEYVESQNWKYSVRGDEDDIIEFKMGLKSKINNCRVVISISEKDIQTYAIAPIKASEDDFANVVEFITRANYGLRLGAFEFDYRDGEVRYHTCISCREGIPSLKDIEFNVDIPFVMMDRYGDGLAKNLMGFGDPARDVEDCESK